MSEHRATVQWERVGGDFEYESYDRDHAWSFPGGARVEASAAADFFGTPERVDPEQALVASASGCHMLTFLAVAAKRRLVVDRYEDQAVGRLGRDAEGRMAVTRIELRPRVTFAPGTVVTPEQLEQLHQKAHKACFIANSLRTRIEVHPPG